MFAHRLNWKIVLSLAILMTIIALPTPATAKGGIWWYGESKTFNVTLINLTEYKLIATNTAVGISMGCFCYPFEVLGVNVPSYGSAVWLSEITPPVMLMHYNGSMTFLPQGMDPKWKFTLNFTSQNGSGSTLGEGTWLYLTAADTTNDGWIPSWDSTKITEPLTLGYLGYATRMNDTKPRNIMNLEASEIGLAVSVFSPNNVDVVILVQTISFTEPYRSWKLDFADNSQKSLPH